MLAKIGDVITFYRMDEWMEGTVMKHYENSVLVKIHHAHYQKWKDELPNNMTVVNHRNYYLL